MNPSGLWASGIFLAVAIDLTDIDCIRPRTNGQYLWNTL